MKQKILKVSWKEYIHLIDKLAEQIKKSGKQYKAIYGVPRGGLIPAVILSHKLGIPIYSDKQLNRMISYNIPPKNYNDLCFKGELLICDDIIDSGKTREQYKDFDFACLHYNTKNKYTSIGGIKTIYIDVIDKDTKVKYPYEDEKQLLKDLKERYDTDNKKS